MSRHAEKQKPARQTRSIAPARPGRAAAGRSQGENALLRLQRTVGNQAVQRMLQAEAAELPAGPAAVHQIAREGTAGTAGPLPHLDRIQRAFGRRHHLGGVKAYIGGRAAAAVRRLGAEAYASGEQLAFGAMPSLQTAAHEAAHVVQQRAGVRLDGGLGRAGDPYEQHASRVAAEVVAGRSAEGMLDQVSGGPHRPAGVQAQAVQFWGPEHRDFTARAVDRWNSSHPAGTSKHIAPHLKSWMVDCSDDADHTGRALTGTVSDLRIYGDFIVGGKKRRHKEYAAADPAKKKELEAAARRSVCASEGPTHGEGNRPDYGSGGAAVNHAYMMSQVRWASRLTFGGFMSRAGAGQLGDAMHCAQDRGSHCEGNRNEGHDDIRDKLGIDNYNTDDPAKNTAGKAVADANSDTVLAEFAKLR